MDTLLQTLVLGIGAGALDALLALGIVLVYRTTGTLNFAQAGTGALAAFVAYSVSQGRPLWVAVTVSILAGAAIGLATYGVVSGIRARNFALTSAVATLAVAVLLQQIIRIGWGASPGAFPAPFGVSSFTAGTVVISYLNVASVITALGLALGIGAALQWTRQGTMIRAIADNPGSAQLCGGNIRVLLAAVWALSGALAAVAGFFIAQIVFAPSFVDPYFVVSLIAAVLGGLRSLAGAFAGAVAVEVSRDLFQAYAPSSVEPYALTFLIVLLIAVLVVAPRRWLAEGARRAV